LQQNRLVLGLRLRQLLFASGDIGANATGVKDGHGDTGSDGEEIARALGEARQIGRLAAGNGRESNFREQIGFGSADASCGCDEIRARPA
jgi:hypothetical protein